MNILLVSETYPPDTNGAAIAVERLAKGFAQKGHNVFVIGPSARFKDETETSKNLKIFRIQTIPLKPIHPYFRAILKPGLKNMLSKIIDEVKPDIIHINNHMLLGRTAFAIAKQNGIPVIGTNHFMPENLLEYFPKSFEKPLTKLMWNDFLRVFDKLDFVTSPSNIAVKMIVDLGLKSPTKVISNGLDLKSFIKYKVDSKIYKKYKINPKIPVFLFVGRLELDKNVDVILRALNIFLRENDAQLLVVGKGKDEAKFMKVAKELNLNKKAIFTGRVSDTDLRKIYSLATVYIGSGTAELQGLAVMEAMASGLPILAVNAVALPELVEDNVNGYLFELNETDLSKKMLKILKNKNLKKMGEESLRKIQAHDKNKVISTFEKLYLEIIKKNKTNKIR